MCAGLLLMELSKNKMTNTKIISLFVTISVAIWLALSAAVWVLPQLGLGRFINLVLTAHPTLSLVAVFPVITIYMKSTKDPFPYLRGVKLALIALIILLPLSVLAESLAAFALISGAGIPDHLFDGERNYIIFTYRGLLLTTFASILGLGFILPAQVKVRQKQLS